MTEAPKFEQSQAYLAYNDLAEALFGGDAFATGTALLKAPVRAFVGSITLMHWQAAVRGVNREKEKVDDLEKMVEDGWSSTSLSFFHFLLLIFFSITSDIVYCARWSFAYQT